MTQLPIRILREPGVEVTDETGKLPPYVSTVLSFAPHLVGNGFIRSAFLETHYCTYGYVFCGSPVRNNGGNRGVSRPGRLCYISAKSASHHVGNRFACSVHYGFLRTIRLGYRNKCISISVKALLKSAPAQLFSAAFFAFCGCGGRGAG